MSLSPLAIRDGLILGTSSINASDRQIKIVKQQDSGILPNRKAQAMHRIEMMASELGRMQKLLDELRADVLHLTIE